MNIYIMMPVTRKDLVEQVFDILTDKGFLWYDNQPPKRHLKEYFYIYEQDEWVLDKECGLCINLIHKRLSYYDLTYWGRRDPSWLLSPYKLFRLDELETIHKLKDCLVILNEEETYE